MRISSAHKSEIKSACLSSVSLHVIQIGYGVLPELICGEHEDVASYSDKTDATWSFLVWIRLWLQWLCGGERDEAFTPQRPYAPNRFTRRTMRCSISFVRYYHHYWKLCSADLSPTQFLEHMCRLSPLGRICIYRMRRFGTVLVRRAMLICYDHGWWRAPTSRLHAGLWLVYLRPN